MSIALFGAGDIGKVVQEAMKACSIVCFVDNNKSGEIINSVPVVSFDEFNKHYSDSLLIITTGIKNAESIADQLENDGITSFLYWKELYPGYVSDTGELSSFRGSRKKNTVDIRLAAMAREAIRYDMKNCRNSQVEFYFVDYFEFEHYLPLYEELNKRGIKAVMVTEPEVFNTKITFNYNDTINLLNSKGIEYYSVANADAPVAITTQFPHNLGHYKGKKCHVTYGVSMTKGKSFILENKNCDGFDLIMTNGEFYKSRIIENGFRGEVVDISYPKYKEFFENGAQRKDILERIGVYTDKQIIIYLPTYDEGASIQSYAVQIGQLRDEYYVITKPHHCTWYREDKKEDLRTLYDISDVVVDALFPLSDLAVIGDIAICDARSGVMNEVSFLNPEIKKLALLTNPDLNQFYIDISEFVDVVKSPEELRSHVVAMNYGDSYVESRKEYTRDFYGEDVSVGIEKAIDAIVALL